MKEGRDLGTGAPGYTFLPGPFVESGSYATVMLPAAMFIDIVSKLYHKLNCKVAVASCAIVGNPVWSLSVSSSIYENKRIGG